MPTSSEIALHCEGLSKLYRIGERERYRTLRDTLAHAVRRMMGRGQRGVEGPSVWALDDVSFEVKQGEVLGIIGRNGAGKSTLLKILSRITKPTRGRAAIHGRVGSLLEVGTGFHPELTGRENIFLNGAILGMSKREIARRFDDIVAFAEIDRFLDTPVKRYSSGMYMRLAFAVAAHLEPEILVIDEVLAVGDAAFQKKCLGKIGSTASTGHTILFVTHNMAAIRSLCHRVLWLDGGRIVEDGSPDQVIRKYLASTETGCTERIWEEASAPGNEVVRLRRASVRPVDGTDLITIQKAFLLEFEYWNLVRGTHLHLSLFLLNEQGITVLNAEPVNETTWRGRPLPPGLFRDVCTIPGDLLNDGTYQVDLQFAKDESMLVYRRDSILTFEVHDTAGRQRPWYGTWAGVVRPQLSWETVLLSADGECVAP